MQLALGILLLVSFLVFIVYAAKGGNLMMGLFVMAVLWCAIGAIGGVVTWEDINTTVFNQGPLDFGSTAVNIIFGSWFGRILVETGIAGTIIRKAVELGGDKPGLTTSLLCIVTTAIFTTAYGVAAGRRSLHHERGRRPVLQQLAAEPGCGRDDCERRAVFLRA